METKLEQCSFISKNAVGVTIIYNGEPSPIQAEYEGLLTIVENRINYYSTK